MYFWKVDGFHPTDAEVAGNTLATLYRKYGFLTLPVIVGESRDPNAPLHPEFEWNDSIAAEKWRQTQAMTILRHIVVKIPEMDQTPVRAFVHISESGESKEDEQAEPLRVYVQIEDAMRDPQWRDHLVRQALADLAAWRRKYMRRLRSWLRFSAQ